MELIEIHKTKKKTSILEFIKSQTHSSSKQHKFYINDNIKNLTYNHRNNKIVQTKYNIITFFPKGILIQFLRFANIYFLIIAIIQMIPVLSPLSSSTALVPLFFVLVISLTREGLEDYRRHKFDNQLNSEPVQKYQDNQWKLVPSGKLMIGDIILVNENQFLPADIVILDSNYEDGLCYVETATLDGEKTLKPKFPHIETINMLKENENDYKKIINIEGECISDLPCPDLYKFNGYVKLTTNMRNIEFGIDSKQLLLKGSVLKNTKWIIGFIIYTGHNTKMILNSKNSVIKQSRMEIFMSKLIFYILGLQFFLCVAASIFNLVLTQLYLFNATYLDMESYSNIESFETFFRYLILLNTMIPISLIISLEIVRFLQGYFISVDVEMYSFIREKFVKAGTISLNEELGMIDYIFSDKTGTLTCNKMKFKYCVIGTLFIYLGDVCYEYHKNNDKDLSGNDEEMKTIKDKSEFQQVGSGFFRNSVSLIANQDKKLNFSNISEFWKAILFANECNIDNDVITSCNPDDVELLNTACEQGFEFIRTKKNYMRSIKFQENVYEFEILNVQEFSSDRKRMSILIRDNNMIKLFIKGADSEIKKRLLIENKESHVKTLEKYCEMFSQKGFRTLSVGFKIIDDKSYQEFKDNLHQANSDLENKKEKVEEVYNKLEQDIILLGGTIVEDKLQDQVPETIKDLRLAKIKIWMLTGDKFETAFNIGLSCNLISTQMMIFKIKGEEIDSISIFLKDYLSFINKNQSCSKYSIIVDSIALTNILSNHLILPSFLEASKNAESVICCRTSPLQKAEIVRAIREYLPNSTTMAIGDGGNDVSMIQEAHVGKIIFIKGIGVYGEEGMRAVQASDFSIGEFKFLRKLLFYHGRHNYIRIADMILYFFYKNFVFTINHLYFGIFSNFSAQSIFDDWFITFYNTAFTSTPLLAKGLLDQDLSSNDGEFINKLLPFIFSENRDNPIFTTHSFFLNIFRGTIHGFVNYFIIYSSTANLVVDSSGNLADLWYFSTNIFTNMLFIVSIRLFIGQTYHTVLNLATMIFTSWMIYLLFIIWVQSGMVFNSVATMVITFNSPILYLNFILSVGIIFIIDHSTCFISFTLNINLTNALRLLIYNKENRFSNEIIEKLKNYNLFLDDKNLISYTNIANNNEPLNEEDKIKKITFNNNSSGKMHSEHVIIKQENFANDKNYVLYIKDDH